MKITDVEIIPYRIPYHRVHRITTLTLSALDNVIVSPHVSWYTADTMERYLTRAIRNCRRLADGQAPYSVVNRGADERE